jgi:hypothetical protein
LNDGKIQLDKEQYLQPQTYQSFNNQIRQPSLPKAPSLQFQRYQIKKESEQKTIEKSFLDNTKENNEIHTKKATIQYQLNVNNVTDYYSQISSQPLKQLFFNSMEIQKDHINAFQPRWTQHLKTIVENYLAFQDKMILLYLNTCNVYLKNIFDLIIKIKEQKKND